MLLEPISVDPVAFQENSLGRKRLPVESFASPTANNHSTTLPVVANFSQLDLVLSFKRNLFFSALKLFTLLLGLGT